MRSGWRLRLVGWQLALVASFGVAALATASGTAWAQGANRVIELFTSQGCSKCPPADRLIADLARVPGTIALSFPVSYWDYIGWKDTLASMASTRRQKAYASSRGDGLIYTPQAIVDGIDAQPGSDRDAILKATKTLKDGSSVLTVPLTLSENGGMLKIAVGEGKGADLGPAGVYVLRVAHAETVQVGRGENSGKSLTYTNVVRALERIGDWTGHAQTFDIHELKGDNEGFVVLLQAGTPDKPGPILAAAKTANL